MTVAPLQLPVWKDVPQVDFSPLMKLGQMYQTRQMFDALNNQPDPMAGGATPDAAQPQAPQAGANPTAQNTGDAPRGLRNNNPLNIEAGEFTQSQPGYTGSDGRFAQFASLDHGINAADSLLQSYGKRGLNTVSGIVSRWAPPGENDTGSYIATVAKQVGVDPNAPLDMNNPDVRRGIIGAMARVENGRPLPDGDNGAPTTLAFNGSNPPMASQPGGAPSPAPQPQAQPSGPAAIAQPWMTPAAANRYESAAQSMYSRATAAAMLNPAMSAAMRARGDAYMKQAEIIRQSLGKNSETTPEQKNAVDPNVTAFEQRKAGITTAAKNAELTPEQKNAAAAGLVGQNGVGNPLALKGQEEIQKGNITSGQKRYEGIQAQSSQYERDLKPYLDVSRSIINDPRFYSGIGGELSLDFNRVKAAFGDTKAAMLQEALKKVTASSVLGQINNQRAQLEEAGGNSSRIFSQQVQLVEEAAPALSNTPAGNRFLVEVSSRMGDLASRVAEMARQYKQQHGTLDTGFDQKLSEYMQKSPVFTKQEMSEPAVLGAPTVPPTFANDKLSFAKWAGAMGLKSGDPIRLPNGTVKAMP